MAARVIQPPSSCRVMTPLPLAKALVSTLGDYQEAQWLEPSHGDGAFLSALSHARMTPFQSAVDGNVIAVARGFGQQPLTGQAIYRRTDVDDLTALRQELSRIGTRRRTRCPAGPEVRKGEVLVSDVAQVRIGAVTGDARYFLLTDSERRRHGLPARSCRRVLTRASHLRTGVMDSAAWRMLIQRDQRTWLFRPTSACLGHEKVAKYLAYGESGGGCRMQNYKVRSRDLWYRTVLPKRPDAFLTGMSSHEVFLTLNRCRDLSASNTLFVIRMKERNDPLDIVRLGIALLSERARRQIEKRRRWYAGGLMKIEPGALGEVRIPWPVRSPDENSYGQAVRQLIAGNGREARMIAEKMI